MRNFIKNIYFHKNFFKVLSALVVLFLVSYWVQGLFFVVSILVIGLVIIAIVDAWFLFRVKDGILASRNTPEKFSNSDANEIVIPVRNRYNFKIEINLIDELPIQFQIRDFKKQSYLEVNEERVLKYAVTPFERGEYHFGAANIFVASPFKIMRRRYVFEQGAMVKSYPSYIQMRKYEFLAMSNRLTEFGLKKIRRIGHTLEFEQIKEYVLGDDVRTINWKTTAKHNQLMVNQYQDEKSQPIYSIIDVSRTMKMPFNGLKLLDYAINATLAFSNIALRKNDKAGLMAFSKEISTMVPASNKKTHLNTLNEALYNINTDFIDADFGFLYTQIKRQIKQRSLLLVYTNFEHKSGLKRQLPYLKSVARSHLLVVIFFENSELDDLIHSNAEDVQAIYNKTIAEKFAFEKRLIVKELESFGIHSILTKPEALTLNVINKYLEFKSRGLI